MMSEEENDGGAEGLRQRRETVSEQRDYDR